MVAIWKKSLKFSGINKPSKAYAQKDEECYQIFVPYKVTCYPEKVLATGAYLRTSKFLHNRNPHSHTIDLFMNLTTIYPYFRKYAHIHIHS